MAHLDQTPEEIIACRDRELAKLRPTPERFYRWWSGLTNDERVSCWYDLDAMAHPEVVSALRDKLAKRDAELSALGERVARAERENEAWRALVHWTHRGIDRGLDAYDDDVLIVAADKVVFIGKSALECAENIPAVKQKLGLLQPETKGKL
jgi:hypothetical protein